MSREGIGDEKTRPIESGKGTGDEKTKPIESGKGTGDEKTRCYWRVGSYGHCAFYENDHRDDRCGE